MNTSPTNTDNQNFQQKLEDLEWANDSNYGLRPSCCPFQRRQRPLKSRGSHTHNDQQQALSRGAS